MSVLWSLAKMAFTVLQVWRISAAEHVVLVVQHHAISDGWSLSVLGRDLAAAYNAIANGMQPQWPPLPVQQVDYAAWQRQKMTLAALSEELAWWKRTLAGAPTLLSLPTDWPRPDVMSGAGGELRFNLPGGLRVGLEKLATQRQTTVLTVITAAVQVSRPACSACCITCIVLSRFNTAVHAS